MGYRGGSSLNSQSKNSLKSQSIGNKKYLNRYNFKKKIIITDLTRMKYGKFCIFGIDANGNHIRPTISIPYTGMYEENIRDKAKNHVVKPFSMIEWNFIRPHPVNPHTEDYLINPCSNPVLVRNLDNEESQYVLDSILDQNVKSIFGTDIIDNKFTPKNRGQRSIGTVKPDKILGIDFRYNKFRLIFSDSDGEKYNLPITDFTFLKFLEKSGSNPGNFNHQLESYFSDNIPYLRVGLAREFKNNNVHYLLVTGIYSFPDYKDFIDIHD